MDTLHEFRVGDWVKIINPAKIHSSWFGRCARVNQVGKDGIIYLSHEAETPPIATSQWNPVSLEFIGTERSLAEQALGEEYFA